MGHWHVLVEENTSSGQYAVWRIAETVELGPDRDTAYASAQQITATHRPANPWREQSRRIYEHGPDAWIVVVEGAASTHHFRVSLVKLVHTT